MKLNVISRYGNPSSSADHRLTVAAASVSISTPPEEFPVRKAVRRGMLGAPSAENDIEANSAASAQSSKNTLEELAVDARMSTNLSSA
jgi:hypothetical protein